MPRRSLSEMPAAMHKVAAIDLGSNSFHMVIAQVVNGGLLTLARVKQRVRLAAGLQEDKTLSEEAILRGLGALQDMGKLLRGLPPESVRAVATHTLRQARNADEFLRRAHEALGFPIEIIAGKEEARLIYAGIAHTRSDHDKRLIIDIGGGSTEFIIGKAFKPLALDSLMMGCVAFEREFFGNGVITAARFDACRMRCLLELQRISASFCKIGWRKAIGSSGTIQSVVEVLRAQGYDDGQITRARLQKIRNELIAMGHANNIRYNGLSDERRAIFAPGVAILLASFESLGITSLETTDAALREGVLFELVGRFSQLDVRERSVFGLMHRHHVDLEQAERVQQTAMNLFSQVAAHWKIIDPEWSALLGWAARLHEIGLAISYVQMHKHGEYLLRHSDIDGFSQAEKSVLAALVRNHRRKFYLPAFDSVPVQWQGLARYITVILRLSVILHHSRSDENMPKLKLQASRKRLHLHVSARWLAQHALIAAELEEEKRFLKAAGFILVVN